MGSIASRTKKHPEHPSEDKSCTDLGFICDGKSQGTDHIMGTHTPICHSVSDGETAPQVLIDDQPFVFPSTS